MMGCLQAAHRRQLVLLWSRRGCLQAAHPAVEFSSVVASNELTDDEEYDEIDMKDECGKFGSLVNLVIPRPRQDGEQVPGVGKVFVEYTDTQGASRAKAALNGRKFSGNSVVAVYFLEEKFLNGDYSD